MERELLLLGMLRMQEQHGYQLNEAIQTHLAGSIHLTKTTAYDLLKKMTAEGWVAFREEQAGNRPQRRIYTITPAGEEAFQRLLRESLASYKPAELASDIGLAFLEVLRPGEALELLQQRRTIIASMLTEVSSKTAEHHGGMQLMIEHRIRHLTAELAWVDEITRYLETEGEKHS